MKTTFDSRRGGDQSGRPLRGPLGPSAARRARTTCSTISPAVRWRAKPAWPVAQNEQAMAQPAWLETHTVERSR